MKKIGVCFVLIAVTTFVDALDTKYAPIVNAALSDLKTHTTLSLLKGHVAVNISSGNKDLDKQFAEEVQQAYPNFESKEDTVHNEDLYQMVIKVYRENSDVYVHTTVTNFDQKKIVERRARAQSVSVAVLETLQYETAVKAKNEFEAYLDSAFADAGEVVLPLRVFVIRAMAFLDKGDYANALSELNTVLALKPDYTEALYFCGDAYYFQSNYDTAIEYYTKAINIDPIPISDPNYDDAYLARGLCYYYKKDYDRAIADFNQSARLRPKNERVFYWRGRSYFAKDSYVYAINDFTKALALEPKNDDAYDFRGIAYFIRKEYDKAISDFTQSIKIEPDDAFVYYLRALAYSKKPKTKKAIADCEKALDIKPGYTDAQELLASLLPPPKPPKPPFDWRPFRHYEDWFDISFGATTLFESGFLLMMPQVGLEWGGLNGVFKRWRFGTYIALPGYAHYTSSGETHNTFSKSFGLGGFVGYPFLYFEDSFNLSIGAGLLLLFSQDYETFKNRDYIGASLFSFNPYAELKAQMRRFYASAQYYFPDQKWGVSMGGQIDASDIDFAELLPKIDRSTYMYFSFGVRKPIKEETGSERAYNSYEDDGSGFGLNVSFGIDYSYFGGYITVDFMDVIKTGGFSLAAGGTLGLPVKIAGLTLKPYAGIGIDISVLEYKSTDNLTVASSNICGFTGELGIQLRISHFFLSAAYRQRLFPKATIEYRLADHSYTSYSVVSTDEITLKRFVISVGFDIVYEEN